MISIPITKSSINFVMDKILYHTYIQTINTNLIAIVEILFKG